MRYSKHHQRFSAFRLTTIILAVLGIAAGVYGLQFTQELWTRARYQPANIQIDTSAIIGPLPRPWANLAQGGEDHAWRMQPLIPALRPLRPEYIRLDHIYDFYDIVSGPSGNLTYDFSKLDPLLDDIKSLGATPYIALSYMPPHLAAENSIVGKPNNYQDWQNMVAALVRHVSGTRGFRNVYYEVWNEPDLFGSWKYYGDKSYITLYDTAVRGAEQSGAVQPYKIGGPATTALYKNWIDALATYAQRSNTRLDFISWHRYSTDIDVYRRDMADVQTWLQAYPLYHNNIELHITEWGHDSNNNAGYDGHFGAAHTAAGAIEMVGIVQRGFVFEIQDGKSPEGKTHWGRWGLFTHADFGARPKPRYQALLLLSRLGAERIQLLGKGTFVKGVATRDLDNSYKIALANYDPRSRNMETVPVAMSNLSPNTSYTVMITSLQKAARSITATADETGTLRFSVPMNVHEVVLVEVR